MASLVLTDDQKVTLSVAFFDKHGHKAEVEGVPVWASSDPVILVEASADGMTAVATTAGERGPAQVSVTADVDLGTGVEELVGLLDIEVIPDKAATIGISAGTPEPK